IFFFTDIIALIIYFYNIHQIMRLFFISCIIFRRENECSAIICSYYLLWKIKSMVVYSNFPMFIASRINTIYKKLIVGSSIKTRREIIIFSLFLSTSYKNTIRCLIIKKLAIGRIKFIASRKKFIYTNGI